MSANGKLVGFDGSPPKARDVRDTAQLNTTAREKNTTGINSTKRHTHTNGKPGKLGAKGHPS